MDPVKTQKFGTVTRIDFPTARIKVVRIKTHPKYRKSYTVSKSYLVHLPKKTDLRLGDKVVITPCHPVSKRKRWQLAEILAKATQIQEAP